MIETLIASPRFAAFLIASLILAITPGPGVVYIVTRTVGHGRKAGFASVCGVAVGNLVNAAAASIGLAAVLSTSSTAFAVVKLAGAAYLVYLGVKALRERPTAKTVERPDGLSPARVLSDGFVVALLNPKTALFFAALLPQFISPSGPPLWQSLALGCVFVLVAMCTDTTYVLTAAAFSKTIIQRAGERPYGRYVTAATLIGLGAYAALAGPRPAK
jgi:threonine/homoserine/homoserine lactone efflux protein